MNRLTAALTAAVFAIGAPAAARASPVAGPDHCQAPSQTLTDEQFQACIDQDRDCALVGNPICNTVRVEGSAPGEDN